jgi:hypothetical protein
MKRLARYALAAALAGTAVLSGMPASAEGYDGDDYYRDSAPDDYYAELSPHGRWIDHAEYGRVWHPSVAVGWRPYYYGNWAWSPYGWTWISSEPWGWTFHYGRWSYAPVWGWVWVPGTVWGPAWVDWYWDDGYVGWAPLSPFATHVTVVNHFVFVKENDFCSPHRRYFDHRHVQRRVHDRWRNRDRHDRGFGRSFRPPDRDRIERVSGRRVQRFDDKPPQTVAPRRVRDGDRLARPRNKPAPRQERQSGWQRPGRRVDDVPDAAPRPGSGRERGRVVTRPRPGVPRREPRVSPPDPAPRFDVPDAARPRRRADDNRVTRSARPDADPGHSFGSRRDAGHRRPAPPAIPGGSMMVPQRGGLSRAPSIPRSGGAEAGVGRSHGGRRSESGAGEHGGRGNAGRGNASGRGDGGGSGFGRTR